MGGAGMIWVLTKEYNAYDQYGEYFIHAWTHKPTAKELLDQGVPAKSWGDCDLHQHVLAGGGRRDNGKVYDDEWYWLREVQG
jgi:hypothetical protein